MPHTQSLILSLGIVLMTGVFFSLNISNLQDVYALAYKKPYTQQGVLPESPVVRIQLVSTTETLSQSYIRGSMTTLEGKSAYFIHVPPSVDLQTSSLFINDERIADSLTSPFENDTLRIYFIPQDQPQRMIEHITTDSLQIRQPPQP